MYDGVSAWRSYFVANEWMKLVTKRRTSMRVQMVAVIGTVLVIYIRILCQVKVLIGILSFLIDRIRWLPGVGLIDVPRRNNSNCHKFLAISYSLPQSTRSVRSSF